MGQGQSKCVDFSKGDELEKKIEDLCKEAKKIDKLNKKHVEGEGSCINSEGLKLFLDQIKNRMLLVAVVGEGSCGKSTLINAFLRDRILPSGIGKVTGFRIFIGHDQDVHKGPCENSNRPCDKCPYLVRGIGTNDVLCHGVMNIKSKIKEMNKKDEKQKDPLVLYTYIPVFDSLSSTTDFTPYLVDSPGVEVITDDVKSYYSILSAMIYVENYQRLLQNEENIIKELGCKTESASLLFAVSHFDKYYTSSADEENPDEEETKAKVASRLELVKREEVSPVCGSWALHAHLAMRYHPTDEISRVVDEAYHWIPKDKINNLFSTKVGIVLKRSAINELEKKLKCSINKTNFKDLNIKMCEQCEALLKGPIQAGEAALKKIRTKIADSRKNIEDIKVKIKTVKIMKEKIQNISKKLEKSYLKEILSTQLIEECTGSFRSSCIDSTNTNYTFGQCLEDWNVFRTHDLPGNIEKKLTDKTKRCLEDLKSKLEKEYNELINILGHDPEGMTVTVEEDEIQVNCSPIGEPSNDIKDFVSSKINKRKFQKLKNAVLSSVAGTGVGGFGLLSVKIASVTASVVSAAPIVAVGAVVAGVCGTVYFGYQGITTTIHNVEISKKEVNTLCNKMNSQIIANSDETQEAVKNALRGYSNSLRAKYDQKWGSKPNEMLKEAEDLLEEIEEEEKKLVQALKKLEECNEVLKVLIGNVLCPAPEDDSECD